MDDQDIPSVIRRLIDAFNALDSDAAVALCTAEFEWRPAMLGGGLIEGAVYHGADGIEKFFEVQKQTWEAISVETLSGRMIGDLALLEVRLEGVGRASHLKVGRDTWNVFRLTDGKVASGQVFLNEDEALAATRAVG